VVIPYIGIVAILSDRSASSSAETLRFCLSVRGAKVLILERAPLIAFSERSTELRAI